MLGRRPKNGAFIKSGEGELPLADRFRSGHEGEAQSQQGGQGLRKENRHFGSDGAVNAGDQNEAEKENNDIASFGKQSPKQPGGEKSVVETLIGGKYGRTRRLLRRHQKAPTRPT